MVPRQTNKRYFLVGQRQRVLAWCQDHRVSPHDRATVFHITSPDRAMGYVLGPDDEIVDLIDPDDWKLYPVLVALNERRR